jgi:hypothetical protein
MADQLPSTSENSTQPAASGAAPASAAPASAPSEVKSVEVKPAPEAKPAAAAPVEAAKPAQVKATEGQPPEAKPQETAPAKTPEQIEAQRVEAEKAADTVPEKYELKNPAGQPIDQSLVEAISPVLKDAKVTTKAAQTLVNNFVNWQDAARKAQSDRDLETLKKDPALGLLNFGRTQARVNDALAAFSTPDDRATLTKLGISNHPTLVRLFHRIGAAMQEPPQSEATNPARAPKTTASKLYGGSDLKKSGPETRAN